MSEQLVAMAADHSDTRAAPTTVSEQLVAIAAIHSDTGVARRRAGRPAGRAQPQTRLVNATETSPPGHTSTALSDPGPAASRQALSCGIPSSWASTTMIGLR